MTGKLDFCSSVPSVQIFNTMLTVCKQLEMLVWLMGFSHDKKYYNLTHVTQKTLLFVLGKRVNDKYLLNSYYVVTFNHHELPITYILIYLHWLKLKVLYSHKSHSPMNTHKSTHTQMAGTLSWKVLTTRNNMEFSVLLKDTLKLEQAKQEPNMRSEVNCSTSASQPTKTSDLRTYL